MKTLPISTAILAIASVNMLGADPSPGPAQKDLDRVIENAQRFDNPTGHAPTAGHTDTGANARTEVPVVTGHAASTETAHGVQTTAPTQRTDNPRPVLTKPTTTTTTAKPAKSEPPSPVVPTGDKKK